MSKELTPLEALENIKKDLEYITRLDYVEPIVRGEVRDNLYKIYHRELPELDIIETALKRLETLEEEKQSFDRQFEKKLKALEIIKEMLGNDLTEKLNANSRKIFKDIFDNLPKERQDLLKEVLCSEN